MSMVSTEQRKAERISGSMNSVHAGTPVQVFTNRDIIKGEQICYSSYNMCEDCGGRKYSYGTPDILRDYGFVEQFPNLDLFRY